MDLSSSQIAGMATFFITFFIVFFIILVVEIAGIWRIFKKAGYEGWECIVPIYNALVFLKIIGKPWWWLIMFIIPGVNVIFLIWSYNMLSKSFGKDEGFTAGLVLARFIFIPILGFGSAEYEGPYGDPSLQREFQQAKERFDFENNNIS